MKKRTKLLLSVAIIGLIYSGVTVSLINRSHHDLTYKNADSLIILNTTHEETIGNKKSLLTEQLDTSITYLKNNPKTQVISCGGKKTSNSSITEAQAIKNYLTDHGISPDRIKLEDNATGKMENLMNAKYHYDLGKTVIAANDFQMYRTKLLANRIGIKPVSGLSAPSTSQPTFKKYTSEVVTLGYSVIFDW
ncbi:YdcF family protein [Vagococcus intermedius]|uniref:YdcF family protein n=1 Tax=Vagococcus intermedius TaxID=2991418 RepID=A0AAF0I6Z0_9ENTE|nr:YdcF family protein [Vagococcus intermedius]WEG72990.1 YdcF family protein [Vagococcus intermedius]WEG75076.1 YdcF family protein [Vagococcus intermedius]